MANEQNFTPKELPGNTSHAISDVIAAAKILEGIYSAEIDALKKPDTGTFASLQPDKFEASRIYYSLMEQMLERKSELREADPAIKAKLREMHEHFSNTSRENIKAIKRMKRCSERLGNTLRKAALKSVERETAVSYCKDGKIPGVSPRKAVSSGVNETV